VRLKITHPKPPAKKDDKPINIHKGIVVQGIYLSSNRLEYKLINKKTGKEVEDAHLVVVGGRHWGCIFPILPVNDPKDDGDYYVFTIKDPKASGQEQTLKLKVSDGYGPNLWYPALNQTGTTRMFMTYGTAGGALTAASVTTPGYDPLTLDVTGQPEDGNGFWWLNVNIPANYPGDAATIYTLTVADGSGPTSVNFTVS
jgi:hypothetical protein